LKPYNMQTELLEGPSPTTDNSTRT